MIKFKDKIVPDAYHGTSKANAQNIIRIGKFELSSGKECYLGDGIYFFEAGKGHAEWWARRKYGSGTRIAVIIATVQLGKCLDLGNPEHIRLIELARQEIQKQSLDIELSDTLVINFLAKKVSTDIETVRGYFHGSPERVFTGSKVFEITHVVICVKNHGNILTFALL